MKIGLGVSGCGGRKSPSPIDKAHGLYNRLYCTTVQAVIYIRCLENVYGYANLYFKH